MKDSTQPQSGPCGEALANALRARTRGLHAQAERAGLIRDILQQRADRQAYLLFLRNLAPVYQALEQGLDKHRQTPGVGMLFRPEVFRATAIASDLQSLAGPDWERRLPLLPAGKAYAARVTAASADGGAGLVAHAYVRYLGDLNGGQLLRNLVSHHLRIGDASLSYYDYPLVSDLKGFRTRYRQAVDAAGRQIADCGSVLEEAAMAFEASIAVSLAVQAGAGRPVLEAPVPS